MWLKFLKGKDEAKQTQKTNKMVKLTTENASTGQHRPNIPTTKKAQMNLNYWR